MISIGSVNFEQQKNSVVFENNYDSYYSKICQMLSRTTLTETYNR